MYPRIALLIVLSVSIFQQAQAQLISDRFRDVLRTHMEFGIQGGARATWVRSMIGSMASIPGRCVFICERPEYEVSIEVL